VMDASRRTTAANAYVAGLGQTKRVVLYDTLVEEFSYEELRLVVAHELSHVKYRDVPNGLLYLAIVAPFGMLAAARLTERLDADREPGPRTVPAAALALAVLVPVLTGISNQLSRDVERRADVYAMELTGSTEAQIGFQRRIAEQNVSDPDPPRAWHIAFGTHPTTLERIGLAEALRR
jgi:STE24 endopeptidase